MKTVRMMVAGCAALAMAGGALAEERTLIEFTQTACQFVEAESGDRGYKTQTKSDCEAINADSGDERLAKSKVYRLKPGKYVFRVTNENVPYSLGFYLRGDGLINRARLPSVSGGGLDAGKTRDYEIDLVPGDYVYSCPLNPTPNYKLVVEG